MRKFWLYLLLAVAGHALSAQQLVKDINANPLSNDGSRSFNQLCFPCGGYVYFWGRDIPTGNELWRTDGSEEGTFRVKDIVPGVDGVPGFQDMLCHQGKVYFRGDFFQQGVWRSDGTEAGTEQVNNRYIASDQNDKIILNGKVIFFSNSVLYQTSGPGDETVLKDFTPVAGTYYYLRALSHVGDKALIILSKQQSGSSNASQFELWVTDGVTTELALAVSDKAFYGDAALVNNKLMFFANVNGGGMELWISDGTVAGTKLVKSSFPLIGYDTGQIRGVANNRLFFDVSNSSSDHETWASDGTEAGTVKVSDEYTQQVVEFNGKLYFVGVGEFYKTDLDLSNKVVIKGPGAFGSWFKISEQVVGGRMLFAAAHDGWSEDVELHYFDGTNEFTLIKDINYGSRGSFPWSFAPIGNELMFMAEDIQHGYELWKTNGTEEGTTFVKDIATGTGQPSIGLIHQYNNKIYFQAKASDYDAIKLFVSDGTTPGTHVLSGDNFKSNNILPANDYVISQSLYSSPNGSHFFKTHLETGVQTPMWDPDVEYTGIGLPTGTLNYFPVGNSVYFFMNGRPLNGAEVGMELWKANAHTDEMVFVKDIRPGPATSLGFSAFTAAALGDKMIFMAEASAQDREPWVSDGTEAGTFRLKDIYPTGPLVGSAPKAFTPLNGKMYFTANDPATGPEIHVTDGTSDGTQLLIDLKPGTGQGVNQSANGMTGLDDKLIFGGMNDDSGMELWVSDGTAEGTTLLKDLNPAGASTPGSFFRGGDKVYFTATTEGHGLELWVTDGTADGTKMLELYPGSAGITTIGSFLHAGGITYFVSNGKIWGTLGTRHSTRVLATVTPLSKLFYTDNGVIFTVDDPNYGKELFRIGIPDLTTPLPKTTQTISFEELPIKKVDDIPFFVDAETTSALPLLFLSSDPSIAEISGEGEITIKKAGTVTITASQDGDEYYEAAVSVPRTLTIEKLSQAITMPVIAGKAGDPGFTLDVTSTSGLPVTLATTGNTIGKATIDGHKITLTKAGKATIIATQAGNETYSAAEEITTFCISPLKPVVTITHSGSDVILSSSAPENVWMINGDESDLTSTSLTATEPGVYLAAAVVDECQGDFSDPQHVVITGVEHQWNTPEVFPNPVEKVLLVRFTKASQTSLQLIDNFGRIHFSRSINTTETQLDISSLTPGLYFIKITDGTQIHHLKFIKQ